MLKYISIIKTHWSWPRTHYLQRVCAPALCEGHLVSMLQVASSKGTRKLLYTTDGEHILLKEGKCPEKKTKWKSI